MLTEVLKAQLDYHSFLRTNTALPAYNFSGVSMGTNGTEKEIGSEVNLSLKVFQSVETK